MGNRERIIEAALDLFNEHGCRSMTTNHIAAHLSISPGNLYYHFRNKEALYTAVLERLLDDFTGPMEELNTGPITQFWRIETPNNRP